MNTKMEKAIFAAGCFWGVEDAFRKVEGVIDVRVGYIGGNVPNPTYENVCGGGTGHAEAVEVTFNPEKVSYKELVDTFWTLHDPTQENGQGFDVGEQYRSEIFYINDEQKDIAERSKKELEESGRYSKDITTAITEAEDFFEAEEYHQQYLSKKKNKTIS